eukprot:3376448-Heterocapsa_arctica.AAC.1
MEVQLVKEAGGTAGLNLPRRAKAPIGTGPLPAGHIYIGRGYQTRPLGYKRSKWANPFPLADFASREAC